MVKFPESPKEVATEMSLAVQAALSDGKRRLEIALPDGLQFGLFGQPPGKQELGDPDYDPPAVQTQRADIELAYLAAEIFQKLGEGVAREGCGVGSVGICVGAAVGAFVSPGSFGVSQIEHGYCAPRMQHSLR
jgi:hypothetical protein